MGEYEDLDPIESQEWQDAVQDVIERDGADRAHYLLDRAVQQARAAGAMLSSARAAAPRRAGCAAAPQMPAGGGTSASCSARARFPALLSRRRRWLGGGRPRSSSRCATRLVGRARWRRQTRWMLLGAGTWCEGLLAVFFMGW